MMPESQNKTSSQTEKATKTSPKKPGPSFSDQALVSIDVGKGKKKKTFSVHKSFICHHSPFFRAAFNSDFVEGSTQTMKLDDAESSIFALFLQWLYTQNLTLEEVEQNKAEEFEGGSCQLSLTCLWIMADTFLIPRLKNKAIWLLKEERQKTNMICLESCSLVYEKTLPDSPLRRFFVDEIAFRSNTSRFKERLHNLTHEILIDVILALAPLARDHLGGEKKIFWNDLDVYLVDETECTDSH